MGYFIRDQQSISVGSLVAKKDLITDIGKRIVRLVRKDREI